MCEDLCNFTEDCCTPTKCSTVFTVQLRKSRDVTVAKQNAKTKIIILCITWVNLNFL